MYPISQLEQAEAPDPVVTRGQRARGSRLQAGRRRLVAFSRVTAAAAALAGAADWSEQHEQQMRVGVVHTAGLPDGQPGRGDAGRADEAGWRTAAV